MSDMWFERSPDVLQRSVADEHLLLPVAGNLLDLDKLYVLDEVGLAVWQALTSPLTVAELAARMAADFEVGTEEAEPDVTAFLDDLVSHGLARECPAPGDA